jgi:CubicO group peptidase (beta-lactamase class C family)/HEAT repeat protein
MPGCRLFVRFGLCFIFFVHCPRVLPQDKKADREHQIRALRDANAGVRLRAVQALGETGPEAREAVPYLIKALDDGDREVCWNSARALGKIGTEAVPALIRALEDDNENIRLGAAVALGAIGPGAKDAVPSLMRALKDRNDNIRENAAEALGKIGPDARQAVQALIHSLSDEDPFLNGRAADALGRIGKDAVPALREALKDGNGNVRWCSAIALGKMGRDAANALPALVLALNDTNENVRWCSTVALRNVGENTGGAVPALLRLLHDKDADVRWGAYQALERIDPGALLHPPSLSAVIAMIDSLTPPLMKELHVPGVAIVLIGDRSIAWTKTYGVTDANKPRRVTKETLFEACSMTKPVFAYTVLKLVEQGNLDLDRPLADYLEEPSRADQPMVNLITARMVLSHTTGLPNWRKGEEERDGPLPVLFTPGSRFGYSGEGMLYLQKVVEHITGEPLELYAKRTLFDPMGLKQMSYVWMKELDTNIAAGHSADGTFLQKTKYTHADAAYTLYTSAEDYAMFLIEIMKTDRSAKHSLSERTIGTMLHRQIELDTREPVERPGRALGRAVYWGLGWSINATKEGDIFHHSGANRSGYRCFSQFNPEEGTGIVIMTNSLSGDDLWSRLIREIGDF